MTLNTIAYLVSEEARWTLKQTDYFRQPNLHVHALKEIMPATFQTLNFYFAEISAMYVHRK